MAVAHIPFDFCLCCHRRNRVHNNYINGAAANQSLANFHGLFTCIRLRNKQRVYINPQSTGVNRVKGMLNIYKSRIAAALLRLGNNMESKGCFTAAFRSVDFNYTATGQTAYAQSNIQ